MCVPNILSNPPKLLLKTLASMLVALALAFAIAALLGTSSRRATCAVETAAESAERPYQALPAERGRQ